MALQLALLAVICTLCDSAVELSNEQKRVVRRMNQDKATVAVDAAGHLNIFNTEADENKQASKQERIVRAAKVITSSGAMEVDSREEPQEHGLAVDTGVIADALKDAKEDLETQLNDQANAKKHAEKQAKSSRDLASAKKSQKRRQCNWWKFWNWFGHCQGLRREIKNYQNLAAHWDSMAAMHQATVKDLTAKRDKKHDASQTARDLEDLIDDVTKQILVQSDLLVETEEANVQEKVDKTLEHEQKVSHMDDLVANLTDAITQVQEAHAELTMEHTALSCAERKVKGEPICKQCSMGKPCGDSCISADKKCWVDPGCACKKEDSFGFIEVASAQASSGPNASKKDAGDVTHEDVKKMKKKIQAAKAALRKNIHKHNETIQEYSMYLDVNAQSTIDTEAAKQRAIEEYDAALKDLTEEKESLEQHEADAAAKKQEAEEKLEQQTKDSEAEMEVLAKDLEEEEKALKKARTSVKSDKEKAIQTYAEQSKAMKDTHDANVNSIKAKITQLKAEKANAQKDLEDLKTAHSVK